jgi:hypothetical protein
LKKTLSFALALAISLGVGVDSVAQAKTKPVLALTVLSHLAVKGRAPKTGYSRDLFSNGWGTVAGCDTRNYILARDLTHVTYTTGCTVGSGVLNDPYTRKVISFHRGLVTSLAVQIDHVVALSDAWQKGAQKLTSAARYSLYNDPLNLLAVDGPTNQQKSDSDAASWLPPNKGFRCRYVARQIAVKAKYHLWVTQAEKAAMVNVLSRCQTERVPTK